MFNVLGLFRNVYFSQMSCFHVSHIWDGSTHDAFEKMESVFLSYQFFHTNSLQTLCARQICVTLHTIAHYNQLCSFELYSRIPPSMKWARVTRLSVVFFSFLSRKFREEVRKVQER